jgi:hypothetical protein
MEYFEAEEDDVRRGFDLEDAIVFSKTHGVQIIRLEDYQYMCYIDKAGYCSALTPLGAWYYGIRNYKERNDK